MNHQAKQNGVFRVGVGEFVVMRLFAEVEMRCDGVLEEMDNQIADENEKGSRLSPQYQALRNHFDHGRGEHEAGAQRDKVAKIAALPVALHNNRTAEDVGGGGGQA